MSYERLSKLGEEKAKVLTRNFDELYEKYKKKALEKGNTGELKFIHEHGRVFIYMVL